jgi:hypothetical protein
MSIDQLRADGWVKSGNTWVNPRMAAAAAEIGDSFPDVVDELMDVIATNLATFRTDPPRVVAQRICSDCGCLLLPGEQCPACRWTVLRWCEAAAVEHSWTPIPYTTNQFEEVAAA